MKNIYLLFCTLSLLFICSTSANAQWVQTNGPYGGNIKCIVTDGTNVYAGSDNGGIYLSKDNGTSWTPPINNWPNNPQYSIESLVISGNIIFAGVGNSGVYSSSDSGLTWKQDTVGMGGMQVSSLAAYGINIFAATNNGVLLSVDNGANWAFVNNGLTNTNVNTLAVIGNTVFAGTNAGVYSSSNNGINWQLDSSGIGSPYMYSFAIDGNNIYAGGCHGVYLSINNGLNWTALNNGIPNYSCVESLAIIGSNMFAGTYYDGFYLSQNNGLSWTSGTNVFDSLSVVRSIVSSGQNIFAGTNGQGIFLSTDSGISWKQVNNHLINSNIYSFAAMGNGIFAGSGYGDDLFLSSDGGSSWNLANKGLDGSLVTSMDTSGTNIFAGTESGSIFLSKDSGTSWTKLNTNSLSPITSLVVSGTNIFAATLFLGIYRSIDNGLNWQEDNNGVPYDSSNGHYSRINALALKGDSIFAAINNTWASNILLSTNNGSSWITLTNGQFSSSLDALVIKGSTLFAGSAAGIYLSTDDGVTWAESNNGLPKDPFEPYFTSAIYSISLYGSNIFAATDSGVYVSKDEGHNWIAFNQGSMNSVTSLSINGDYIYAGTESAYTGIDGINGFGIWKRHLADTLTINCGASFSITADTTQLHHYIVVNYAFGKGPLSYDWSWGDGSPDDTIPYPSHTYANAGFYNICLSITDSTGCQSTFCDSSFHAMRTTNTMVYVNVVTPLILGTQGVVPKTQEMDIYPNPATNQLTIHTSFFQKAVTVSVMNMLGQMASPPTGLTPALSKGEGAAVINISKLPAGMYFLQLKSESGSVVKKFVKE